MKKTIGVLCGLLLAAPVMAESLLVHVNSIDANGIVEDIGFIEVSISPYGVVFKPEIEKMTPGLHGFHIHQNPTCAPGTKDGKKVAGLAAGGHWDPEHTGKHLGPYSHDGHKGDLPDLYADENGNMRLPVLAPRISVEDLKGHSLIIHAKPDNYSDDPAENGGSGARVACAIIKEE